MNYKSKQHIFDLLELVLKSNHLYYTRLGMEYSFMHPDEILNEFQLAFNDYSEHRVAILKDLIAKLQQQHRDAGSVGAARFCANSVHVAEVKDGSCELAQITQWHPRD